MSHDGDEWSALKNFGEVEEEEQKRRNRWMSSLAELKIGFGFCFFVFIFFYLFSLIYFLAFVYYFKIPSAIVSKSFLLNR